MFFLVVSPFFVLPSTDSSHMTPNYFSKGRYRSQGQIWSAFCFVFWLFLCIIFALFLSPSPSLDALCTSDRPGVTEQALLPPLHYGTRLRSDIE